MPDIELSALVQERPLEVLLNDEGTELAVLVALASFQSNFYIIQIGTHSNAGASIGELSWLDYPNIFDLAVGRLLLIALLNLRVVFEKFGAFGIVYSTSNVESQWKEVEHVLTIELIVFAH